MTRKAPAWMLGLGGLLGILAFWWLVAATFMSKTIPTPWAVVVQAIEDGTGFYWRNLSVTLAEAGVGYLWGNGLALVVAALVLVLPATRGIAMQLAVISYCIPIVAIGPVVRIIIGSPASGEPSGTAIFLAAMSVFFTTVVGALLGLRSADKSALDLVSVYGGGRWQQLIKVQLIAALPAILNALKVAAPAAVLGAVLGEYIGGVDAGLGPAMINAQQSLEVARVWGVALVSGLAAGAGYAVFALLAKLVTPWSTGKAAR
ncbi:MULTISPECIES: ABC transporter permease subunit [unclassified Diaminobutyricimonas]|uniref:ABC transporter permease n=1 Tax=unclassified Diaminobutyricimonas TaxID=2643261 RepID=UPI001E2EF486|nr:MULTISPECIES: ABC transporter permease subunit [unclassified Diaminobutyricimonas]